MPQLQRKHIVELFVVSIVLLLLLAVSLPRFFDAQVRTHLTKAVFDLDTVCKALHQYYADYKDVPPDFDGHDSHLSSLWIGGFPQSEIYTYQLLTSPTPYLESIPNDVFLEKMVEETGRKWIKSHLLFEYATDAKQFPDMLWSIQSVGPDFKREISTFWIHHNQVNPYLFHVSNGINSNGEIYGSNLGVIKPY